MNKIYKTKYSVAKKEIVVVSELTASHGKETSSVDQNNKKLNFSAKLSVIFSAILAELLFPSFVSAETLIMKNGSIYAQKNSDYDDFNTRQFVALNPAGNLDKSNPGPVGLYSVVIGNDATGGSKDNDRTTVIGYKSKAIAGEATVVGATSGAGSQAVAVGANVYAQGYSSIAIGSDDPIDWNIDGVEGKYGVKFPKETLINIYQDLWTGADNKKFFANQTEFLSSYWSGDLSSNKNEKAIWSPTYARKLGAIAIGTRTIAGGEVSTSIGTLSFALADRSTAMGIKAYVDTAATGGTAIGENSRIFAPNSVAIGNKTEATSQGAMAYGYQAYAVGKNSIAIGSQVAASGAFYTANTTSLLPAYANLSNAATQKNGDDVTVNLDAYTKFDTDTNSLYTSGVPLWRDGDVYLTIGSEQIQKTKIADNGNSSNSIVIGGRSYAVKKNSLAIGYSTLADSDNSFAIGSYTYVKASSNNSIAVGVGSYVSGADSFLAGTQSRTESQRTVVLGPFSTIGTNSERAMTFGYYSSVGNNSSKSIAFGASSHITNGVTDSMAFGTNSFIDASQRLAANGSIITGALALGKGAIVRKGDKTKETGNNAMALGKGALAMLENSVALGVDSRTDYKYEDLMLDPWVAKGATSVPTSGNTGVISVGSTGAERRIVNVASGRLDTDAVNVAQLKTIDEKFDIAIKSLNNGGGVKYLSIEHINSAGEAGAINAKIKLGENYAKYVNLKKTLKNIEARKKLNNDSFNEESVKKLEDTLKQLQDESVSAGVEGGYAKIASSLEAITIVENGGNYQEVLDKIAAAAETDSKRSVNNLTPEEIAKLKQNNNYLNDGASGIDSIAFGFGAKTSGEDSGNKGKHAIAIGYEAEANGENAIAIGNLAKALANNALSIGNGNKVSGANSGALGDPNYVSGTGTYVVGNDNGTSTTSIAATNSGFFGNSNKTTIAAQNARVIGNLNTISANNVMVFGNEITANVENSVYLGNNTSVSSFSGDSTAGVTSYNKYSGSSSDITTLFSGYVFAGAGSSTNGAVSVGSIGKERRIQNVAAGLISAKSTDAINGSQLYATNDLLGKLATTKIKFTGNTNSTTETQLYSPDTPLNFDIKGDENDLTSKASGKAISFSLLKETSIEDKKDSLKTATTKAIYDAIVGAKTTVTQTPNSPYLTVTPTVGTGLTANAYSVAFDYDALKRDLTGELPFAKSDASNLSSDNITAWKNTLGLNNLSPNIGYRAGESTERKTVQASTGLTFVSKDENKLKITAKDEGIIEFSPQDYAYTKGEVDQKLNDLTSTLNIAGDGTSQGSVKLKSEVLGVKGTDKQIITKAEGQNITVSLAKEVTDKITKIDDKLDKSDLTNEKISGTLTKGNVVDSNTVSVTGTGANRLLGDGNLSFDVKDGSITSAKLADKAVTSGKIADGAVTADKLYDIKLKYKANNEETPKEISLKNGSLKFTDGNNTTASVENDGVVKYSVKTTTLNHDTATGAVSVDDSSKTYFATAGNVAEMFKKTSESLANKGLDFTGSLSSNGLKIHRNLGDEVKIIGAKDTNEGLGQITDYSAKNLATLVDATSGTIQIAIKKTPEFEGILLKGQDGTNGKDGFIGVDKDGNVIVKNGIDGKNGADTTGSKVVTEDSLNATAKLAYKANNQGYNGQENPSVSLTQGLNFTNGSNTTAEIAADGVVKYNVNTATLENNSTTGEVSVKNSDSGTNFATAKNVADTINAALGKVSNLNLVADNTDATGKVELPTQSLSIKGTKDFITTKVTDNSNDITIDLDQKVKDQLASISSTAGNAATKSLNNIDEAGKNVITSLITATGNNDISVQTTGGTNGTEKNFSISLNKADTVATNETKAVTSEAVYKAITGAKTTVTADKTNVANSDYLTVGGAKSNDLEGNTFTVGLTQKATDALKAIETALKPSDGPDSKPSGLANTDLSNISDQGKNAVKDLAIEAIDVKAKENSGLSVEIDETTDHKKTFTIDLAKATLSKKEDGTVGVDKAGNTFATAENVASTINDISSELTNKGLTFKGDSGADIAKKLGDTVTVKGGVTNTNNLTENNIGVIADKDQNLVIQLAKKLSGLTSVATETLTASTSVTTPKVIFGTGDNAPTLTGVVGEDGTKAIDFAGAKITKVGKGTENDDAVNVGQLKELGITPDKAVVSYDNLDKTSITLGQKGADGENSAPVAINNVASGLGLDGKDADGNGSTSDPKAISPEKAKDAVAKLLETKGEALNKATNVGDLQAVAQAGLDFVGNDEKVVHRPLGTKLSIAGEGVDKNASQTFSSASGNINVVNNIDNTLTIQLAKALTNISSIGGSEGQGKISFDKGAVNFNDNVIAGIKSAVSEPTEGKDYLDALANADDSSAVNVSDLKNATEALGNKLTDAGLSFAGDSGNNVTRKLSETLSIKGGVTDASKLTDDNIGVVADGSSSLNVKLSSELKGMTSFETAANADGTSTKLDANGIKVTGQDGKSAEYGLDGSTIANKEGSATYGANDVTFKDANNKELIKLDAANNAIVVNGKDGKDGITINGETKTITGLDQRTINGEDYGKGDNRGNAATEGAVKDLADAIGVGSTNKLPVDGATGAGGKDGLNGTSILDKVQALRDGTAGNAVYTTESGERLIKLEQDGKPVYYKESDVEKAADGSSVAKEGAKDVPTDKIVISTVNPDGSTTKATKLANVASSIGGEVKSGSNSFIDNLNKVGATGDGSVNPNTAVTAQDLKNLADTGFKLQTNDNKVDTVKAGNTVQVKDGINTKVSKVEEKAGVFSYSINVNGVPMTYVNKEGKALAKVGDRFFLLKDNGELDLEGSTPENTKIAGVALVDPQGGSEAQTLDNIKNGELKADSKQAVNGGQIANILGTDAEGKAITTNIGGTGKDNIDSAIKAVKTASVSEVTAGDNVEINTVESDSGKKVSISTSMNPNFDTVGLGAIRDQDGKLQPRISLGVTKDGALAVAGADGKSPVRITNVADPVQDSDAVNKRYVDMHNRKLRGGIAGAIATASLPQAYTSGKSLFAVSGGTYGGQSAVALGVSRISDNGKMIIKLVGSTNTQGSVSGGVGVGFEW